MKFNDELYKKVLEIYTLTKDGNKQNNDLNNLEWCTSQENTLHGIYVLKTINKKGRIKK